MLSRIDFVKADHFCYFITGFLETISWPEQFSLWAIADFKYRLIMGVHGNINSIFPENRNTRFASGPFNW